MESLHFCYCGDVIEEKMLFLGQKNNVVLDYVIIELHFKLKAKISETNQVVAS